MVGPNIHCGVNIRWSMDFRKSPSELQETVCAHYKKLNHTVNPKIVYKHWLHLWLHFQKILTRPRLNKSISNLSNEIQLISLFNTTGQFFHLKKCIPLEDQRKKAQFLRLHISDHYYYTWTECASSLMASFHGE